MYSNKENVNILTSLLVANGVCHAVVCPGSRNAPIVHNLNEVGTITCHPVTDERSAGFYAIGLAQVTGQPVVVCVTSGSALLNVAPAVAEASYQHIPLVVVSADRPQQWIGQLDGQTLPQQGAFGPLVRRSVQLPEPHCGEERWMCRRLVNEALLLATCKGGAPVHINVPITEPLFTFDVERLPEEQALRLHRPQSIDTPDSLLPGFMAAERPMIVFGQLPDRVVSGSTIRQLIGNYVVIAEPLSNSSYTIVHGNEAVRLLSSSSGEGNVLPFSVDDFAPDYVLYVGDTVVSKNVRRYLRGLQVPSCLLTADAGEVHDPLMSLADIVECPYGQFDTLLASLCGLKVHTPFYDRWQWLLHACSERVDGYEPPFSQMAAVKYFESQLDDLDISLDVHYANSSAIRLANIYASHRVWCNRGVNGIEGSLSTAAGFSLASDGMVVCVIGDLSFFYDQNALWNNGLRGNLRIILLNNRCGGIFSSLPGLGSSPAAREMVAATHNTDARGICTQNDIGYLKATTMDEMQIGVVTLLTQQSERPMLLEVFTDAADDAAAMKSFENLFTNIEK